MVDSWAWIEYFKGSTEGKKVRLVIEESEERIVISTINISEVYRWVLRFYDKRIAEDMREAMKERAFLCDVNEEIAVEAAKIKHEKKWGLGDSIVYATAKSEMAKILTGDPDFKNLKDVIFIS